jgi:hypothetical protein
MKKTGELQRHGCNFDGYYIRDKMMKNFTLILFALPARIAGHLKFLLLSFILLPCLPIQTFAQADFLTTDALTYRFYQEKKWDSLLLTGKKAIRNDIDYFYLRTRMGIAYYETQRYISAANQFYKATRFNSEDPFTMGSLYLSYLYSNRPDEARALTAIMAEPVRKEMQVGKKILDKVYAEGGPTFSSDNTLKTDPYLMGSDSLYGDQDLYRNSYYGHLDLTFNLSPHVSLSAGYNYLNFSKVKYFQYGVYTDRLDSTVNESYGYHNYYSYPKIITDTNFQYHTSQQEIFLGTTITLPARFKLMAMFHLVNVRTTNINAVYSTRVVTDTIYYDTIYPDSSYYYPFTKGSYSFSQRDSSFYNYLFSLTLTKDISVFTLGISGSLSNLNNMNQYQAGAFVTYYPLGNLNLYGNTALIGFFEKQNNRLIFSQTIGGKILSRLWLEGNVVIGDLTNANLGNGSVIYNNTDKIDYRLGANLLWSVSKHIELSLNYQFFQKESINQFYSTTQGAGKNQKSHSVTNKYQTNTIIGGLTWKL